MDCSLPGSSVHGILQARVLELGYCFLLQGIFLTQESNLGLLHCRQILYWNIHVCVYITHIYIFFSMMVYPRILTIVPSAVRQDLIVSRSVLLKMHVPKNTCR